MDLSLSRQGGRWWGGGLGDRRPSRGGGGEEKRLEIEKIKTVIDTHNRHYCTCISTVDARLHKLI